ncbi:MAG: DNA polymerase III subunit epsilon [Cellvibrionales bacterium]|nr:DNA polymerase III subunit epsilon [Cellvibrionales bacterium]
MSHRIVILDTETTGIDIGAGNRLIEIGCVELVNRKLTGNHYHQYINPERDIEEGAYKVHGIGLDFLADKPLFADIADDFLAYIKGAELVIHNAPFDVGFLNHELGLLKSGKPKLEDICTITDTLVMAKDKHPGQRNSLDALCKRYSVDNSGRELHGALLDSELLADVYLLLTGGQTGLDLFAEESDAESSLETIQTTQSLNHTLKVVKASNDELTEHDQYLAFLDKKQGESALWRKKE